MNDSFNADLLARLQALPPEERNRLLAQLGLTSALTGLNLSGSQIDGTVTVGEAIGRDKVTTGDVSLSDDARINGVVVGVNLGRIVYGREPEEDERRRLVWYLARLASKLSHLPLRGIEERLDQGAGIELASENQWSDAH
jgi:hypothetical protein